MLPAVIMPINAMVLLFLTRCFQAKNVSASSPRNDLTAILKAPKFSDSDRLVYSLSQRLLRHKYAHFFGADKFVKTTQNTRQE